MMVPGGSTSETDYIPRTCSPTETLHFGLNGTTTKITKDDW